MVNTPENPARNHYLHASVPEHKADLDDQAKNPQAPRERTGERALLMEGVIFENRYAKRLFEALDNPNDPDRLAAEKALWGFTRAVDKPDGITINSAAQEFNVPENFFWRWAKERRLIPIVSEGKGQGSPTYLDKEKAQEVAEVYHEAKRQRRQPKKLLEAKYPEISKVTKK